MEKQMLAGKQLGNLPWPSSFYIQVNTGNNDNYNYRCNCILETSNYRWIKVHMEQQMLAGKRVGVLPWTPLDPRHSHQTLLPWLIYNNNNNNNIIPSHQQCYQINHLQMDVAPRWHISGLGWMGLDGSLGGGGAGQALISLLSLTDVRFCKNYFL